MDYVTKEDLQTALAPFATRDELRVALAQHPTRDEMHAALARHPTRDELQAALDRHPTRDELQAALDRHPTREDMHAALMGTRDDLIQLMREEGDRTRRHFDVVTESLRDDIRLLAESQVALHQRVDGLRIELKADIATLDRRVMRLEAARE